MSGDSLRHYGFGRYGIVFYGWVTSPKYRALGPAAKHVYTVLSTYADGSGRSFPSREQLAADTGLYPTSVSKAISELEDGGFLRRYQGERRGRHNVYFLTPPDDPPSDADLARDLAKSGATVKLLKRRLKAVH